MPLSQRPIDVVPSSHAVMRKSMPPPARWLVRGGATANLQSGRKISGQLGAAGAIRPQRSRLSAGKAGRDEYERAEAERWLVRLKSGINATAPFGPSHLHHKLYVVGFRRIYMSISPNGIEAARTPYFVIHLNDYSPALRRNKSKWSIIIISAKKKEYSTLQVAVHIHPYPYPYSITTDLTWIYMHIRRCLSCRLYVHLP